MITYGEKMKKFFKIFLTVIVALIVANCFTASIVSFVNYTKNLKYFNDNQIVGVINNQHDYSDVRYGFGNMGDNGCGAVAIYNILTLEDKNPNMTEIIRAMDLYGTIGYGLLGTAPHGIMMYLSAFGYNVKIHFQAKNFESVAINSKYSVFCYVSLNGGHYTVMYDYDETDSTFQMINPTYRDTFAHQLDTVTIDYGLRFLISVN